MACQTTTGLPEIIVSSPFSQLDITVKIQTCTLLFNFFLGGFDWIPSLTKWIQTEHNIQ